MCLNPIKVDVGLGQLLNVRLTLSQVSLSTHVHRLCTILVTKSPATYGCNPEGGESPTLSRRCPRLIHRIIKIEPT